MNMLTSHKVDVYNGKPVCISQVKFDGYYSEIYKSKSIKGGIAILYKKQNLNMWPKLVKHDAIREQVESLPDETIMRAELHGLSYHATSVPTLVNNHHPHLLLSPFSIEMWAGKEDAIPFATQDRWLKDLGFTVPAYEVFFNAFDILNENAIKMLKKEARERKIEGFVVKDVPKGNAWKIKPEKSIDAFIVDYNISDSDTYSGGLKSVVFAVYDDEGKECIIGQTGSGFTGDYKLTVDPKSLIGRVAEFGFQSLGSQGRLKFPKFLRWRDDEKTPKQCKKGQLCH